MTTLHIELSDEVRARLVARAAEAGFGSVEQYAQAVLRASADVASADVASDDVASGDDQLEDLLVARASDGRPGDDFTPAFVDDFHTRVQARRGAGGRP